ncbi:sigma-70 family RNA polymerase sigma factor [Planctomycetota bacterium]
MRTKAREVKLLTKCLKGDSQAFEVIVAKYQELVCAITYSGIADIQRSEELAQQTFVNAWKNLYQLKDLARFRPWLCTIARNNIRNFLRKTQRDIIAKAKPMENIKDTAADESGPLESAIKKEHEELVSDAIQQIPERYREPLVLYYRQQKSVKQVALSLDLSEETIKQRLQRGRKMIKEQLSSIVEETLSATGPKKVFTATVIASVAGLAIKGTGVAAAAGIAGASSTSGTATSVATIMSGVTAKIITAAAVVAIGVGAVVTYKQITKPGPNPEFSQAGIVVHEEENSQEKITKETPDQPSDKTANLLAIETHSDLKTEQIVAEASETISNNDVEFKFAPKGVLSGLITDINSSEPIEGIKLRICSYDYVEQYVAKTDSNGMYFFENIKKDGPYTIRLETNEYVTPDPWKRPRESVQLAKSAQFVKHFQLRKGCKVNIEVVDPQDNPIKGISFFAAYVSDDMGRGPKEKVRSDKEGAAAIGGLKPAEYLITAQHRDYALAGQKFIFTKDFEAKSIAFEMKTGFSVEGKAICSDGHPASGWEIYARPVWWNSVYCAYSYPIDANGVFVLEHVLPGDYQVGINIPEGGGSSGLWSTKMALPPEDGFIELNIPKPSPHIRVSISGTLEFLGGEMERGIWITARDDSGNYGTTHIRKGQKDFTITNLVPGLYKINIDPMGSEATKIFRNIKAPSEGLIFEIPMKKKISLRGKVLDKESGEAIAKFKARVSGQNYWQEIKDPDGIFEIQASGEKCQRVQIKADGFALKTSQEICPDANELTMIELGIGGAIEGIVLDEKRKPIQGAKISYRYRRSRDEESDEKYITTTDANGLFIIEDVPEKDSWQWFVINHPDYAPELKQIEVQDDYITDIEIVLKKGGAVEGYVYDAQGKIVPDTTLYFISEPRYRHWKENMGRLGSVTTDSNGFYRITCMPEKLCFGFRHEPDEQLGVVCTAILPRSGKSNFLDFGGQSHTTGRLLQDDTPMANIKVLLQGNAAGHETAFTAYALTNAEGKFTFWGIPQGRRYVYWSIPGLRGWGQWSEIGRFDFESGVDMDLGDFELQLAEVTIGIATENPNESLSQLDVYVQDYDEKMYYGRKVGQLSPRTEPNAPYVFSNITHGKYEAIVRRSGYPTIHKVFEVERGQEKYNVDLWIPAGSASLSGKIIPSDPKELQMPLMLRSVSQEITMGIQPAADGSYEIGNLPAGDYIIGRASVALSRQSKIKEVRLKSGENKKFDIEVDSIGRKYGGYLVVVIVTEEGLPLAGAKVWLEKGGDIIEPHFDSDKSTSFAGDAGEYILYAEYPGYRNIQQKVRFKSTEGLNTQEILKPVVITMSK